MTSCRHHSGYLADDEAGPTTYVPRVQPPKKPLFPEMGRASKVGHMPHPPSTHSPVSSSGLRGHCRNLKGSRPFRNFLDFLVEGQVLDSLQTVVEVATERMATMKTGAGLPLVEMQDPVEVPKVGRRACSRPSLSTVHRHRTRPSLCVGHPNNYPSCSSSMSDSHSSFRACWPGSQCRDSDLDAHSLGPLPAVKDRLLLEKSLKRLLQLENRGKGLGQCCSHRDSLPWDSLDSQASSQWTPETPLSWFSELLGSSSGTLEASELGPGEQELVFLKREFNKQIKSLLSQPVAFDLPGYCAIREPHRTLDFLAEHHLFPALQNVVNQAVDKLSGACRHNGCPLFPSEWEPTTESNSKLATPTNGEEPDNLLPTTASSPKVDHRKNVKPKGRSKPKGGGSPVSSTQVDTRFRLEMTPTEEPKVPSPHLRHESPSYMFPKKKPLPSILSKSSSVSHLSNPWQEELVSYLKDQAVSLLIYKHKFEKNLTGQLGFISFPVTEALMDLFLGFKRVKGSRIHLSSKINWSCLLRRLEEAQSSQQVSQRATRWVSQPASQETSQHNTPQRSPETPTVQPELATRATKVQDKPTEPHLDTGLLLTPQENAVDAGQETSGFPEPKVSTSADTSVASHLSKQKVDKKDKQSIEKEVEEEELEDAEEEEEEVEEEVEEVEEEVEEDDFFGDKDEPQSSPESPLEATGSPSADSIVGPSDSP